MRLMNARPWAIGLGLAALTIGSSLHLAGQTPAAPVPAQMTAAQDHQRMMDALHIAKIPPGPGAAAPRPTTKPPRIRIPSFPIR